MSIEIIQDETDDLGLGVTLINQPPHLVGEVLHGALRRHGDMPPPRLGFAKQKEIPRPVPLIGVIVPRRHARASWQGAAGVRDQLLTRLIKDDGRPLRIVGLSVEVQELFHPGDKVRADRRDAPLLMLPRLKVVFLSTWRTVSWES